MSNRSLNRVQLIGNLTRDPELRYTPQGTPVCSFGMATNRSWVDANGQKQEATEFHRIVAWQKLAELCSQLLFKGRKTYVDGRLQTRNWTGSDGQERTTTEVVIDNMIVLDSKRREEMGGEAVMPPPVIKETTTDATDVDKVAADKPKTVVADKTKITAKPAAVKTGAKTIKTTKAGSGATGQSAASDDKVKPAADKSGSNQTSDSEEVKADDIPF